MEHELRAMLQRILNETSGQRSLGDVTRIEALMLCGVTQFGKIGARGFVDASGMTGAEVLEAIHN